VNFHNFEHVLKVPYLVIANEKEQFFTLCTEVDTITQTLDILSPDCDEIQSKLVKFEKEYKEQGQP